MTDTVVATDRSNANIIDNTNKVIVNPPSSEPVTPLQFPPRAEYFTGRSEQLAQLTNELQPREVVTLCGAGGMGKTALAAEVVHRLAVDASHPPERFPDGVIFHSFYNNPSVESAMMHIAFSCGVDTQGLDAERAVYKALNAKVILIVLDGAEDADNLDRVLKVLSALSCGVLITTRDQQQGGGNKQKMQPLEIADAVDLLSNWAADQLDNKEIATEICEEVGRLPLAVRLVGRYLNQTGKRAEVFLDKLKRRPLKALDPNKKQHRLDSVPWLLAQSVKQVSEEAQQVLAVFGQLAMKPVRFNTIFNTVITNDIAEKLNKLEGGAQKEAIEDSEEETEHSINELINFGLVQLNNDQYEVTHALIHTYTREQILLSEEAFLRLVAWYENFAETESKKGLDGYHILDTQQAHILYLIEQAHQRKQWQAVIDLMVVVDDYLGIRGYWRELKRVLSLALTAAQAARQHENEGKILDNLGVVYRNLGEVEKAINFHQQVLVIKKKIGDRQGEGISLCNLGNAYYQLGEVDKAIDYYQQALVISKEVGSRKGEGVDLGNLGVVYADLGELDKAIDYYQQALVISQEVGDRQKEETILGNLGGVYGNLGELEKAIDFYQQALVINKEVGNRQDEGNCLGNLGSIYGRLDKPKKAIEYFQQALVITQEIGDRQGEGNHLGNLGVAYSNLGEPKKAIDFYQQALVINKEIGNRHSEGTCLNNLGSAYYKLNQVETARDYYQQALEIWEAIHSPKAEIARDNLHRLDNVENTYKQDFINETNADVSTLILQTMLKWLMIGIAIIGGIIWLITRS